MALLLLAQVADVGLFYRVPIANQPLMAPVSVVAVGSNSVTLIDGRVIELDLVFDSHSLQQLMIDTGYQVDIETNSSTVWIFAKQRSFHCGTGRPRTVIPLIPQRDSIYERRRIASGDLVQ